MLQVGGLTPLTSIDYPGELATVVFCQGCPWRCGYCHNPDLLAPRSQHPLPWPQVMDFLRRRQGLLDAVVFSGGEPTLQWALGEAMDEVRSLGFRIGLHTAGIYPRRLSALLPRLDWVGLDIKALPEDYRALTGAPDAGERAWRSLHLLLASGIPLEVRTTLVPPGETFREGHSNPGDDGDGHFHFQVTTLMYRLATAGVQHYALQIIRDRSGPLGTPLTRRAIPVPPADFQARTYAHLGQTLFPHFELR
jgi:pyruvate formate lyase activating enzyme